MLKAIYGLVSPWNDDAEILYRPEQNGSTISTSIATNNLAQKNAVFDDLMVEDNLRLAGHILRDGKEFVSRRDEVLASLPMIVPLLARMFHESLPGKSILTAEDAEDAKEFKCLE